MDKRIALGVTFIALIVIVWVVVKSSDEESINLYISPEKSDFLVDVVTTGELRAKNSTDISGPRGMMEFRINQVKIQRLVAEGSVVNKGDFVAELDRSEIMGKLQDAQLDVQTAESLVLQAQLDSTLELSQARDNLINLKFALEERQIELDQSQYESPAVQRRAEIDLDKARRQLAQETKNYQTKVMQAEAKLQEREAELSKKQNEIQRIMEVMNQFTVFAPEQGMVIYRKNWDGTKITEGSQLSSWSPTVAVLPDFRVMESVTYINEVDIQKIELGQEVFIGLDAMPEKSLTGIVTSVANIGEQRKNYDSKVFEVIVEVHESDSLLRPAMTTSNQIIIEKHNDALHIPLEAIHAIDSLSFVAIQEGSKTYMQEVELGPMNDNSVIINRGIVGDEDLLLTFPDTTGIRIELLSELLLKN